MPSQSKPQPLEAWIVEQIRKNGPISVAQFMAWVLYHPELGYYTRGPNIGPRGDFTTSPEASPAFGRLLARHLAEIDILLGNPAPFQAVEFGPGRGTLACDLLDTVQADNPGLYKRLRYWLVDVSPALIEEQEKKLLPRHDPVVQWRHSTDEMPTGLRGAVIANELVDAFPVHVLENRGGEITEQFVTVDRDGKLSFTYLPPSQKELSSFLAEEGIALQPGERVEVNRGADEWLHELSRIFDAGIVTIIDYGDQAPERYSPARREGTMLAYYGGEVTDNILAHPGEQDLTALVDFTALRKGAVRAGFTVVGTLRQANFLLGLGLGTSLTAEATTGSVQAALNFRRGMQALISMEGLGRFHVLLLAKGLAPKQAAALSGLKYASV